MIKKIELNYPEFGSGLKIDREFTSGINIIEENNAYGKSTILKTIMSLYTGKFGTSKTGLNNNYKYNTGEYFYSPEKVFNTLIKTYMFGGIYKSFIL